MIIPKIVSIRCNLLLKIKTLSITLIIMFTKSCALKF